MQGPKPPERARQEFLKEIQIDPGNAGAHYVLGELARRDEKCEEAIPRFSEAIKFDPNFAEAYLGKGLCLVTLKKYEEAIPPLRSAERLTPGNPEVHHTLATALQRSGHKEEAEKEFSIHRSLTAGQGAESPAIEIMLECAELAYDSALLLLHEFQQSKSFRHMKAVAHRRAPRNLVPSRCPVPGFETD